MTGETTLTWDAITDPGQTADLVYDVFRADTPDGFQGASCAQVAPNQAIDSITPAPGDVDFFLIRASNPCGDSAVATGSGGAPRKLPATCTP